MFCQNCGKEIGHVKFCPHCGAPTNNDNVNNDMFPQKTVEQSTPMNQPNNVQANQVKANKHKKIDGCLTKIAIFWLVLIVLSIVGRMGGNKSNTSSGKASEKQSVSSSAATSTSTATAIPKPTAPPKASDTFEIAKTATDMLVGEINKDGAFYVGLSAVKSLNYLQLSPVYNTDEIANNQEVIYVLLEVCNDSENIKSFSKNDISLYCDSIKAADPDTHYLVSIDGYQEYSSYQLDPETCALIVTAYVVDKGWKELTVFSNHLSWKVTPDDLLTKEYRYSSLFDISLPTTITSQGTEIYSNDYSITYDGFLVYTYNRASYIENYAVFEFTVTNTSNESLDYDLVGHNMRGYQNLRLLESSTWAMNDIIDGYENIHKIDSIKPGMSAKIYIAFEVVEANGVFTCVYDTGYITNDVLGTVVAAY